MPIYEYQCESCHHQLEAMQKMSDPPLVSCPHCKKDNLVRLVSATSFQLKGEGWYVTDFRDKGTKKEKTSPAKTEAADSAKKDSTTKGESS